MRYDPHLTDVPGDRPPFTALLAESVVSAAGKEISGAQFAAVRRILIDWLGVALAGSAQPVAMIVRDEFAAADGAASLFGSGRRASVPDAALINGTAGHALDYDDVQQFVGHPAAAVVPAALALAEAVNADGSALTRAIIAGYDAAHFVGTLVMPGHYDHGFHSTATIGTFGATAASCVLMEAGRPEIENAIGLAATQAAGLKCMFGTMAKPFHAGRAAFAAVVAARLAARGMTANIGSLETAQGFLATQAHQAVPPGWRPPAFGESLAHLRFKFHASCYLTHSAIEAVRALVAEHGLSPCDVESLILRIPAGHLKVCNIEEPGTGLESKFSLRHVAALALSGYDTADIAIFSDRLARDDALRHLRGRVCVQGDLDGQFEAQAILRLAGGQILTATHDASLADACRNDLDERLNRKFAALTAPLIGAGQANRILDLSYSIPDFDLTDLLPMLRVP